ncbi:glycosyltransferase family 2 protein [Antrihabitans stalactiti]|uniref:Glycosyltransferase family 2 protein n=1 Tax=Antrihabitans stalactiti TaxID=2584121 RepID=A0A848KEE0_9NOCA|nr:glycosyltransferase family A protein [Antrihabitans stalactiti]NMN96669.1 glycosyltransferase family 2 protein [Antrihabitans stalactiti]
MSDRRPTFSFLMTAYRTEAYLPATIESVLAQTDPDWQLVVVDNGNSDDIAEIVTSYRDDRIVLVRQENKGYAGGVHAASENATGHFVCVLDSDDQLLPTFCERVGRVLREDSKVDVVGIDAHRFYDDGPNLPMGYLRSIGVRSRPDPRRRLTKMDALAGFIPYYTAAIRREAWDAVGGYDHPPEVDESVVIWLRLVQKFDVRILPDRLARYRLRMDSLSRDASKVESFDDRVESAFESEPVETTKEREAVEATLRTARYLRSIRQARSALLLGETEMAREAATRAFALKRTVRAASILAMVRVSPGLLRRVHPIKQRVTAAFTHVVQRVMRTKGE